MLVRKCSGYVLSFKELTQPSGVIVGSSKISSIEKGRKAILTGEETIPPYPTIPHLLVLQRNEAPDYL